MTNDKELQPLLAAWRAAVRQANAEGAEDLDDRARALSAEYGGLRGAGLDAEEAFLISLRRIGERHAATRDFTRRYASRLLHAEGGTSAGPVWSGAETGIALGLAVFAALAAKVLQLFGPPLTEEAIGFYARNESVVALAAVAAYFGWKRRLAMSPSVRIGLAFVAAAVLSNAYPFAPAGATETLAALHLPVALWLAVGIAHAGGRWRVPAHRMRFVQFSGELFIHGVLIALGGLVLSGITLTLFGRIGVDTDRLWGAWVLPCGVAAAAIIAAWLTETGSRAAGLAPLLARIFTPLCTAALAALLVTMAWTGTGMRIEREVLLVLDVLLAVVVGLVLYAVSARPPETPGRPFDALQFLLVTLALIVDLLALGAMGARIAEFGFTPNRTAALGLNLILLANLAGSGWFYLQFLRGRGEFAALERWQTRFLPVLAAWAAVVAAVFPPLFGYR